MSVTIEAPSGLRATYAHGRWHCEQQPELEGLLDILAEGIRARNSSFYDPDEELTIAQEIAVSMGGWVDEVTERPTAKDGEIN